MNAVTEAIDLDAPPVPLIFTDSAAMKVRELVDEEGNPELKLRVFVQGGGCSGFQYGFTFDEIVNDDDTQMAKNGLPNPACSSRRPIRSPSRRASRSRCPGWPATRTR